MDALVNGTGFSRLATSLAVALLIVFGACAAFGQVVAPHTTAGQTGQLKIIATVFAHAHRANHHRISLGG
ncbi:MAG TPA: hypothetical protein VIG51_00685 [Candidatus Baltobacteraceae bacterium]|jgi:hypothetical protein